MAIFFINIDPAIARFSDSPCPSFSIEISLFILFFIDISIPLDSFPKTRTIFLLRSEFSI